MTIPRTAAALPGALGLAFLLSGCDLFGTATVEGRLLSAPEADAEPIAGAVVALYDIEGQRLGHDDTDEEGAFRIADLPPNIPVATVADAAPEFAPTVFIGNVGSGTMTVPDGAFYALSVEEAQAFIDSYGDLAVGQRIDFDSEGDGGAIRGRVWGDVGGGALVPLSGVFVEVYTSDETVNAVYLDEEGAPDPSLEGTSAHGSFGVFNLPPGTWAVVIYAPLQDGSVAYVEVPAMVVEDGITLLDNLIFEI